MSDADIEAARNSFRVDSTMSAADIMTAIATLTAVVQREADAATAEAEGADDGESQRRADALEDAIGELENIWVEADPECPACGGDGVVDCDGGSRLPTCPGDDSCPVCKGETHVPCTRCGGTGEIDDPVVTEDAVREVQDAVSDAFRPLP